MNSGGIVELVDAFDFDVMNTIPNEHLIEINILITADEGEWYTGIGLIGYNAVLELISIEVIDGNHSR